MHSDKGKHLKKGEENVNTGLLEAWRVWDFFYQHVTRLEYVNKENENIFRVVFCKYRGPKLDTRDGVAIYHGDPIVKLHIHNWKLTKKLYGIENETQLGIKTLRIVKESMPDLARYIENHPKGTNVKAIIGTTFLHRGVNRLGFDVANVPDSIKFKWKNMYLKFLLFLIHPNGTERLKTKPKELSIKRVYLSKKQLITRYAYSEIMEEKA